MHTFLLVFSLSTGGKTETSVFGYCYITWAAGCDQEGQRVAWRDSSKGGKDKGSLLGLRSKVRDFSKNSGFLVQVFASDIINTQYRLQIQAIQSHGSFSLSSLHVSFLFPSIFILRAVLVVTLRCFWKSSNKFALLWINYYKTFVVHDMILFA